MKFGRSLHVGINRVSSVFPAAEELKGAENDARAMRDLAERNHFKTDTVVGSNATYATVVSKLLKAAEDSNPGDIFLFTFAGHGTSKIRLGGDGDELDDEALLLFDSLLFDDELRLKVWPKFKSKVRVLMVADSCHSGTVIAFENKHPVVREISAETRQAHLAEYNSFYGELAVPVNAPIKASVLLLAACKDTEKTPDGNPLGVFTQALLNVVTDQKPANYRELISMIAGIVGPQTPVLTPILPADEVFILQRPFTI